MFCGDKAWEAWCRKVSFFDKKRAFGFDLDFLSIKYESSSSN
jgi:hypothetical protein